MKICKKIFMIMTITLLVAILPIQIFAASLYQTNLDLADKTAFEFINKISNTLPEFNDWKKAIVFEKNDLDTPEGLTGNFVIYELNIANSACGYIILDRSTDKIVEFSSGLSPFRQYLSNYSQIKFRSKKFSIDKMLYYPGLYAIEATDQDSGATSIIEFTKDELVNISVPNISKISENDKLGEVSIESLTQYKLISGVPDSPYYISCIPTAIGNAIGYWDTHGYSNLIVSPCTLYNVIYDVSARMIYQSGNNKNNAAIPDAVEYYCHSRYPSNFDAINLWSPSWTSYKTQISYNRPTLLGFDKDSYYGDGTNGHMTCGVGYYWDGVSDDYYSIVHDAWSSTSVDCYQLWGSWNDFICKIIP